jgi:nudix-type nucleoside diphosphatase (YffH/AdpP family)
VPQRVEIQSTERILDGFFRIERAILRHERFDGRMSAPLMRLLFERGDAVAVLPYDRQRRQVVLVQQFRYPAYVHAGPGWLWEIIAGMQEEGQTPEEVARREALEEAGCRLDTLKHLMTVYPSPGGSSERVHIYLAAFTPAQRIAPGGGLSEDGEDIHVQSFDLDEAWRMLEDGRIVDAKTVLALQYLALHPDAI